MKKDYYKILDVSPSDSPKRIKEQYLFFAHAWHPDKFPAPAQKAKAEERMKEINEAYEVLSDAAKKAQYDKEWHGQQQDTEESVREKWSPYPSSSQTTAPTPDVSEIKPAFGSVSVNLFL